MSSPLVPTRVLPFLGLLFKDGGLDVGAVLTELMGDSVELSRFELSDCSLKNYYANEMGDPTILKRCYITFENLIERDDLVPFKMRCNDFEKEFSDSRGNRMLNLDPGYIALEQVILATNKPYSHRVHLKHGIYADLTYQFKNKKWEPFPWTYPDYLEDTVKEFFLEARSILKKKL